MLIRGTTTKQPIGKAPSSVIFASTVHCEADQLLSSSAFFEPCRQQSLKTLASQASLCRTPCMIRTSLTVKDIRVVLPLPKLPNTALHPSRLWP